MAGRKTKLNPDVQKRICDALQKGNTRRVACLVGGVDESTFYNWINRGQEPQVKKDGEPYASELPFVEFFKAVTRAEAECESFHVENLLNHAKDDWRASIEWLKRRKKEDWSDKQNIDLNANVKTEVKGLDFTPFDD